MALLPDQPKPLFPPMVYVGEKTIWEYRTVSRKLSESTMPTQDELNQLGKDGWELVTVFSHADMLYLYFKRIKP